MRLSLNGSLHRARLRFTDGSVKARRVVVIERVVTLIARAVNPVVTVSAQQQLQVWFEIFHRRSVRIWTNAFSAVLILPERHCSAELEDPVIFLQVRRKAGSPLFDLLLKMPQRGLAITQPGFTA